MLCKTLYKNCAKDMRIYHKIPNFNGEHSNMHVYKTLKKSWTLKL